MSGLAEIAQVIGLETTPGPQGELHAEAVDKGFKRTAVELAERSLLADLFARVTDSRPSLTAVFEVPGDPAWLLLHGDLSSDAFDSLTPELHAASWYEREIAEMYGVNPRGHPAPHPLRLEEDWPADLYPMRSHVDAAALAAPASRRDHIPTVRGQGVFQLPLGPVRSGPQESAEFLFNSGGEDLVMVAPRLGYKFRAVERLAEGKSVEQALILAERLAGISNFANTLAFVQAVERATGVEPDLPALMNRTLLNELERLHSHFGNLGRLADSTGLTVAAAQYALLKEEVLRACALLTGHRYLRGILARGGLRRPLEERGREHLARVLSDWHKRADRLGRLLEATATFIDRLEQTALLPSDYALQHNLIGPIGRSSGADRDTRRDHPYAGYSAVLFEVLVKSQGDALARVRVLLFEVGQSLSIVQQVLAGWPDGPVLVAAPHQAGAALGWSEAPGGQALHFVELDGEGRIVRWRARPPAFVNWHPFAHACASGNNLTDYPVIEASFALSIAEFDR